MDRPKPRPRLAVVSPFLDKRHGTERIVLEWISRLVDDFEIHVYSQYVKDVDLSKIVWHRIPKLPGPLLFSFLWWFAANRLWRMWDRRFRGLRYDLVFTPGINCLDADVISVHIVFGEFLRRVGPQLQFRRNPVRLWPQPLHRRLYYRLAIDLDRLAYPNPDITLIHKSLPTCRFERLRTHTALCRAVRQCWVTACLASSLVGPVVRAQDVEANRAYTFGHLWLVPSGAAWRDRNFDIAHGSSAPWLVHLRLGSFADVAAQRQGCSQQPDPDPSKATTNSTSEISWKKLPANILKDQKDIWLFPTQLARGRHWLPAVGIVGVTGAFIASDPTTMPYFRRTSDFDEFTEIFSGTNTGIVEGVVPASIYIMGWMRHDSYAEHTALLIAEAYVDSAIPHVVAKVVSRRLRPSAIAPTGDFSDTFFRSRITPFGKGSSFPSGHAAASFSIATVLAERYRRHHWVPWVAYGAAGLISFSRVPDSAHFVSDTFFGAVLGYAIAHFEVMRRHSSSD